MAAIATINVRVTINGADVPGWRLRLFGPCARILRVPLEIVDS